MFLLTPRLTQEKGTRRKRKDHLVHTSHLMPHQDFNRVKQNGGGEESLDIFQNLDKMITQMLESEIKVKGKP